MVSAYKVDRLNARGQIRSTVYFRHPQTGERVCDGTYPKKIGQERVRKLLAEKVLFGGQLISGSTRLG